MATRYTTPCVWPGGECNVLFLSTTINQFSSSSSGSTAPTHLMCLSCCVPLLSSFRAQISLHSQPVKMLQFYASHNLHNRRNYTKDVTDGIIETICFRRSYSVMILFLSRTVRITVSLIISILFTVFGNYKSHRCQTRCKK